MSYVRAVLLVNVVENLKHVFSFSVLPLSLFLSCGATADVFETFWRFSKLCMRFSRIRSSVDLS